MKRIFVFFTLVIFFTSCETVVEPKQSDLFKGTPWEFRYQELRSTVDPATKSIPMGELRLAEEGVIGHFNSLSKKEDADEWIERGPYDVGGRTRALMYDPNDSSHKRVFAGGATGGLWVNDDITDTSSEWNSIDDFSKNISITCLTYDPQNTNIMYCGTGESTSFPSTRGTGVLKSIDGGVTWDVIKITDNGDEVFFVNDIAVRVSNGISELYVGSNGVRSQGELHGENMIGLYKSFDGGSSFVKIDISNSGINSEQFAVSDIEIDGISRIWVGTVGTTFSSSSVGGKILMSEDGINFTIKYEYDSPSSQILTNRTEIGVSESNPNTIYAVIGRDWSSSGLKKFMKSTDGGDVWLDISSPIDADKDIPSNDFTRGQSFYDLILAVNPNDESIIYVGGIDLFMSDDGGASWKQISKWSNNNDLGDLDVSLVHADQHSIIFNPSNDKELVFGNDGGIYFVSDISDAETKSVFEPRNKGYNVTQFYATDISSKHQEELIGGSQDNGSQYFDQPGMNITREASGGDGAFCFFDENNPYLITSYVYNNYYLINLQTGSSVNLLADGSSGDFINTATYDSKNNILFTYKSNTSLYMIDVDNPEPNEIALAKVDQVVSALSVSKFPVDDRYVDIYLGTSEGKLVKKQKIGHPYLSKETVLNNNFVGNVSSVEECSSASNLLVTVSNYSVTSVWYSNNGGVSWMDKEGDLPNIPVRWALMNPNNDNIVILATEVGIYETSNFQDSSPTWLPQSKGMANVRVTMLRTRSSDNKIVASTYGRGLYTSDVFSSNLTIDNFTLASEFKIYPNPIVDETLKIEGSSTYLIDGLEIINLNGQVVMSEKILKQRNVKVDVSELIQGQYILKVRSNKGSFTKKILIE